ncbi:zinc finger protein 770-like [Stegastes partitus]|uniref:Zinc finger protein 770-like n=1 Tax=Stegastes partitus TaxID=144197 RepID=A0A9Y4MZQ5_9TELE|nr:PREDICTED: zinc finger protein 770-like [Stegastes partitus]
MHQCPVCSKCFLTPYKLKRHHVIHTGQKPFICRLCLKAFTQSAHLKTHLQNVHHSGLPTDCLQDGSLSNNQQPTCDQPAAEINTHGKSNYGTGTSAGPSSGASTWTGEVPDDAFVLPPSKSGNVPINVPHVSGDGLETLSSISNSSVPQEQVDSSSSDSSDNKALDGYTCKVCLESFPSSRQLSIHSPIHNTPKRFERSRELLQTCSKKLRVNLRSQELISSKSKITLKHQCPKCLKVFCSPSKLRRHFLIHTGQKPYSCAVCRRAYRQKVHLKSHLRMSSKCSLSAGIARKNLINGTQTSDHPTPVNSSMELELQCKISVNAAQDLSTTEITSHSVEEPEQPLNSNFCIKLTEQEQQFMTHKSLKPFQCSVCSRSFRLEVNLVRHHKIHRKQKELSSPTPVQNRDTLNMSSLEAIKHLPGSALPDADPVALNVNVKAERQSQIFTDHSGSFLHDADFITSADNQWETCQATSEQQRSPTMHQCPMCSKCFPSESKLQRHIMVHTGQRPFGCEICGKMFRQKTHLRVHYRTHTWSKYHKQRSLYINRPPSTISWFNTKTAADVPVQGRTAQRKDYLNNSPVVSGTHLDQTALRMNVQTKDNREPENKLLSRMSKRNAVVHMRKVSRVIVKRTQTVKSEQNPGSVPHKCFQCLKCFPSASKLQRHELVHTGLKPFRCLICGKTFRQAPHLKTHERTHCNRKSSKSLSQQGNTRKLKIQQQLYPKITVQVPAQKTSVNTESTLSHCEVVSNVGNRPLCTVRDGSVSEVNSLLKTNSESNVTCEKRKLHVCRICCKNFSSPYKLSRHLVTHSGIRPYRCILCSKTFTQKGHLKIHEHRCRRSDGVSDCSQVDGINTNYLHDKCVENPTDCTDFNMDATVNVREAQDACVSHYTFADEDLAHCSDAIDTKWVEVPEVGLKKENSESEQKQGDICYQATDNYSLSFASELAFEINEFVQNQNMAAPPLSNQHEGSTHNIEIPCQPAADSNKPLSDGFVRPVVDSYWCEPLTVFECHKCAVSFTSKRNLKQHVCLSNVQLKMSAQRNHCNICFKDFVSPSKLRRHYLVHTGQRPFRCDICGKTFTQSAHLRTHRQTH